MRMASPLVLAGLLALAATPGAAQEIQVPLDANGQIEEIDRDLAERLGILLDQYPALEVARLYGADEGAFILEITFRRDGRTARQRIPMTAEAVAALRARVSRALAENAPEVMLNQEGRYLLLGTTTMLGITFYGFAVPAVLDIDNARVNLATYMFTAGASFVGPYLYTRSRPVTYGMANAGFWGATRGLSHGAYLANTLDSTPSERGTIGAMMAASVGEGLFGYTWARRTDMTAGRVHTIGNYGDYGAATAGQLLLVTQPDDDRLIFGTLLAGSIAGVVAGAQWSPSFPYTWGDAEVERAAYFLGAAHGAVVYDWFWGDGGDDNDLRALGALLMAGSVTGTALVHRALDGRDFSVGEGVLVELGAVAGGLLGMGVGVLAGPEDTDETFLFTLGAAGADLGFVILYHSLGDNARKRAAEATRGGPSLDTGMQRIQLHLDPGALLLSSTLRRNRGPGLPVFSFSYRF